MDFSYLGRNASTANSTSYTFSSVSFGAEASNRYIIISVVLRAASNISVSSVTIGGVTASVTQSSNGSGSAWNRVAIAVALVPTGATGNVVISLSGTGLVCDIGRYRALGLKSLTPTQNIQSTSTNPTASLNIPVNGFAIGVGGSIAFSGATWSGMTEDFDVDSDGYGSATGGSISLPAGQNGRSITITFSGGSLSVGRFASWEIEKEAGGSFLIFFT